LFPNEKLPIKTKSGAIAPIGDSMSTHIKYAYKRHNTWVYRRTYPIHLQHLLGSSLKQSLKTADAKIAKVRVAELNESYQSIVKEAEREVPLHAKLEYLLDTSLPSLGRLLPTLSVDKVVKAYAKLRIRFQT
jgi:hypothetical protein